MIHRERLSNCLTIYTRPCLFWKQCRQGATIPRRCSGGGFLISGRYFLSPTASSMKLEKKPFLFKLFLTGGATAKIFYSNGFWEFNEQNIAVRVETPHSKMV